MAALLFVVFLILLAKVTLVFIGYWFYIRNYKLSLRYSSLANHHLPLAHANYDECLAEITPDKIFIKNITGSHSAIFLEVRFRRGFFFRHQPVKISTYANGIELSHTFERACDGIRYIHLSPHFEAGFVDHLTFRCKGGRLVTGTTRAISYKNTVLKGGWETEGLLIISPHPDDAEIAAGGLYAENPANTHIITVTDGGNGRNLFPGRLSGTKEEMALKKSIRTLDSLMVPQIVGVPAGNLKNLGFADSSLRELYQQKESVAGAKCWPDLVDAIKECIERCRPKTIVMPHPEIDPQVDHIMCALATLEAIEKCDLQPNLLMYANHSSSELYPLGPRGDMVTVPYLDTSAILVSSLISVNLSNRQLLLKELLLHAMHDLKNLRDHEDSDGCLDLIKSIKKISIMKLWPNESYFRRALRYNELFYALEGSAVVELKRRLINKL